MYLSLKSDHLESRNLSKLKKDPQNIFVTCTIQNSRNQNKE